MSRWPCTTLVLTCAVALAACWAEEDKKYDKNEFALALAEATCTWVDSCCDAPERDTLLGSGVDRTGCIADKRSDYATYFRDASPEQWNDDEAVSCVDAISELASSCPRAFDADREVDKCNLVTPNKNPGDMCDNSWDCTTKFCKSGVCANPLPENSSCTEGERCMEGLKCVSGTCTGLQPDGAACATGAECISGACGGGQCVVSEKYTCDGQ